MPEDVKRRKNESTREYNKRGEIARMAAKETAKQKEAAASTAGEQVDALKDPNAGADAGPMPKQSDYASTSEWATALRKWREKKRGMAPKKEE